VACLRVKVARVVRVFPLGAVVPVAASRAGESVLPLGVAAVRLRHVVGAAPRLRHRGVAGDAAAGC